MKSNKYRLIISLITLFIFLFTTIGFATYNKNLTASGSVYFKKNGVVAITNVTLSDESNLQNPANPTFTSDSITFNLTFNVESASNLDDDYYAEYDITMSNASFFDYAFASSVFTPSVETNNNQNMNISYDLSGITLGEIIPPLSTKTFKLKISMFPVTPGNYSITGETGVETETEPEEPQGSLLASIPSNSSVNVRGSTVRDKVVLTVINSYDTAKNFTLAINNSNFKLVDSSGNNLGNMTVLANTTQTYDVYIERKSGVKFATNQVVVNLTFNDGTSNTHLGAVKVLVDQDQTLLDDKPPLISNVQATFVASNGKVNLSWNGTDVSGIDHFVIQAVNTDTNNVTSFTTSNSNTSYQATGLTNGSYYFRVYGIDTKQISGSSYANDTDCKTTEGYCSRSTEATYTWVFEVKYTLQNVSEGSGVSHEAIINEQYTGKIQANSGYSLPNSITVKVNGTQINNGYSYSNSNGNITINANQVTGPIEISASGNWSCLVKGTKVLLANGKYKKIEDINYNDLIAVWSYDTGSITYTYPIWIEQTTKDSMYQKTTFSDGSVLKTVGYHGVFSPTYNAFISVDDYEKFKVGTKITKVVNNKLKEVKITKIEKIYEEVEHYHVVSTRYYNIIANDFLTTDGTVILSNLYGFDKNITWPKLRNEIINNKNNLYSYSEFSDIMPYYMFNGLRAEEGKYLNTYGLDKDKFMYYLSANQMNESMLLKVPTNKKGKRVWMVTNDRDNILNKKDYLYEEGSYYTLPYILGVKKWYSTSEDKYYKPLDKVKVNHAMHFIAK